jgi:hypothetical protein
MRLQFTKTIVCQLAADILLAEIEKRRQISPRRISIPDLHHIHRSLGASS